MLEDVSDPALFRPMRFGTLEEAVLHAKRATFTYLERKQHKEMPDQPGVEKRKFPKPKVKSHDGREDEEGYG
jgi:hypothetical protein